MDKKVITTVIKKLIKKQEYMANQYMKQYIDGWNNALIQLCIELNIEI